jgi:hypothetical protein
MNKKTRDYDLNMWYTHEGNELVFSLYHLEISINGTIQTMTDELYDSFTVPQREREIVDQWILDTYGINILEEEDVWVEINQNHTLPDATLAPKTAGRLTDLPEYEPYDWRECV